MISDHSLSAGRTWLDEPTLQQALEQALPTIGEQIMPTLAETWREQGRQQGMEKGMEQGELIMLRENLRQVLTRRFGALPDAFQQRPDNATRAQLELWFERALELNSLDEVLVLTKPN